MYYGLIVIIQLQQTIGKINQELVCWKPSHCMWHLIFSISPTWCPQNVINIIIAKGAA